jgi:Nitrous oxide-stimulated promoter
MPNQIIEFTTDKHFARRARELKTINVMLRMYCCAHAHSSVQGAALCASCSELQEYASRRLERCVFGDAKPTCTNCLVHCYSPDMREQVRVVMRWAGPRMLFRHPILGILHIIDGKRPSPRLPEKPPKPPRP